jgi:hypothetical protein
MVHRHPSEAQCCCLGRTLVPLMTAVPLLFVAVVAPPAATSVDVECLKSVPLITASWTAAAGGGSGVAWRGVAWRGVGNRRPQSGGDGSGGGDSARNGRCGADDRSFSRGHWNGSGTSFLGIHGRCRADSIVRERPVDPADYFRRRRVRLPDRGFELLAGQTGTCRGGKANIGGQHDEGRCNKRAKHQLQDGLLLLVTNIAGSGPKPGVLGQPTPWLTPPLRPPAPRPAPPAAARHLRQ